MKVCVSAYACSPYQGSEAAVGWGFVSALSELHELWVIVEEEKFRADIERFLADNSTFSKRVHFIFLHKKRNRPLRKIWPPSYYFYYRQWHRRAYETARRLHREIRFDLAHQLSMVGFREPGYLWELGIPFVWGPIGGMGYFPWRFLHKVGIYGAIYFAGYNLFNFWQTRFLKRPRAAARIAKCGLIAATSENVAGASKHWNVAATQLAEVGVPSAVSASPSKREAGEPLRIAWSGQHKPGKALGIGLEGLARLPRELRWSLDVLGQGRMTDQWIRLSERLGIAANVVFHGWIPRERALVVMGQAHVMLITSLRDLTSSVTIEALASGLPVICPDHCGFRDVIDSSCGILVPVTTPSEMIDGIQDSIILLAEDEELRRRLSVGAIMRAREFSWARKAAIVDSVYRSVTRNCL